MLVTVRGRIDYEERKTLNAIYGPNGAVVAWLETDSIRSPRGAVIGRLSDDAVYNLRGGHVGYFNNRMFRDNSGHIVAFMEGATGGPVKPVRQVRPVQPV
ncbi:4-fold beta flower protein [Curtobacterium sp. MCBD17_013]|uniref:4-fold beta flower protein n=1 Tax=Curtobacterium sp. MCBD17_013 TaxID=2175668 RepID=UPI0035C8D1FC